MARGIGTYITIAVLLLPKLQSHFAEFLQLHSSIALIYSTHPLVSVFIMYAPPSVLYLNLIKIANIFHQEGDVGWLGNV